MQTLAFTSMRRQQTIGRSVRLAGFGLFGGRDVELELCPAPSDHGIVFERVDLPHPVRIPAHIHFVTPQSRCTTITRDGAQVAVIEHVMAALAGLRVDNCLIRINAPEPPVFDGSSLPFVEALDRAGIVAQDAPRTCIRVDRTHVYTESDRVGVAVQPACGNEYEIGFLLDYGPGPLPVQSLKLAITPESFRDQLADCRTFVLEQEAVQLRAQGLCLRAGPENAVVITESGVLGNSLRHEDECVRHKILDCVGDFALLGCDVIGRFTATRSGHRLSHEIVRLVRAAAYGLPAPRRAPALPGQELRSRPASHTSSHVKSPHHLPASAAGSSSKGLRAG